MARKPRHGRNLLIYPYKISLSRELTMPIIFLFFHLISPFLIHRTGVWIPFDVAIILSRTGEGLVSSHEEISDVDPDADADADADSDACSLQLAFVGAVWPFRLVAFSHSYLTIGTCNSMARQSFPRIRSRVFQSSIHHPAGAILAAAMISF